MEEDTHQKNTEETKFLRKTEDSLKDDDPRDSLKVSSTKLEASQGKGINTLLRQIIGSTGPWTLGISGGMIFGYSAVLLPQLEEDASAIKLTRDEASWIASVTLLQMAACCLVGGWAMDKFGRKRVNLVTSAFLMLGWAVIASANSMEMIMVGRFICGNIGLAGPSSTCYLGEINSPKLRGIFLAGMSFCGALGIGLTHLLGTYLTWYTVAVINALIPTVGLITLVVAPESYVWLLKKGRFEEGKDSFHWFRGGGDSANQEIDVVMKHVESGQNRKRSWKVVWQDCCQPRFIKPFLIIISFFVILQFSGTTAIAFYSVTIMQSSVPGLQKYSAMLIVDAVRLVMSMVSCVCTKRFKVRILALTSGTGTAISLLSLATFTHLNETQPGNKFYATAPIVCFIFYIILLSIGLSTLPWVICGEILPPESKGIGNGTSTAVASLAMFAVVKTNPAMFQNFGVAGTFVVYGGLTLLGTVVLYFILPETKNKTLKDIEAIFAKKSENVDSLLRK